MAVKPTPRERIVHPDTGAMDLATIMRTVGEPIRLETVRILADGSEQTCGAIAEQLGLPHSTASYHLKHLRDAGVTRTRAEGTLRYVSLRSEDLESRFPGLVDVLTRG